MKTFKRFDPEDIVYALSSVEENIQFDFFGSTLHSSMLEIDPSVKIPNHWVTGAVSGGFYLSVYDRDHTSPASNHLYDISFGASLSSSICGSGSTTSFFLEQKHRVYRQFAQTLLGHPDKQFTIGGAEHHELIFVTIRRNHYKDKIKPGFANLAVLFSGSTTNYVEQRLFKDKTAKTKVANSFGGEKGPLNFDRIVSGAGTGSADEIKNDVGEIYYDKGIMVLIPYRIAQTGSTPENYWYESGSTNVFYSDLIKTTGSTTFNDVLAGMKQRFHYIIFVNKSKVRTTFYKCVAGREEFNYSPNPSFTGEDGTIRVLSGSSDFKTRSYISRVGLLGENGEVIAVGTLNRAVRKDFDREVTINVRLDY